MSLGHFYVRLGLGLVPFLHITWRQGRELFGSEGRTADEHRQGAASPLTLAKRAYRTAIHAVRYLLRAGERVTLPVDGQLAIRRSSGAYKVIDLRSGSVYTVLTGAQAPVMIEERASLARSASRFPFAPKLGEVAPEEGWLAEELIAGEHPLAFSGCSKDFDVVYLPLLLAFLRAEPVSTTLLHDYARQLAASITAPGGLLGRLTAEDQAAVSKLATRALDEVLRSADAPVPLALSHGDFFSGNIFIGRDGEHKAIDWANMGRRSPLHDLYYLLLNHCKRVLSPPELEKLFSARLGELRAALAATDPVRLGELEGGLVDDPVLRWLFYLECIQVPLERCKDPADRYIRSMLQRVDWYEAHERELGNWSDDPVPTPKRRNPTVWT